jgi:hypothetical protein
MLIINLSEQLPSFSITIISKNSNYEEVCSIRS